MDGDVAFSVAGDHVGTTNGAWRLVIERGKATCANLRMAGHLSGGMENDEALDRVLVPRPIHIRDYF